MAARCQHLAVRYRRRVPVIRLWKRWYLNMHSCAALNSMDTRGDHRAGRIHEKIGYHPARTPFVGKNFNVTRAGIHADGLLKNEEIYNIFDTEKFLNRPVLCAVSNTSGLAGIAHWINTYFHLPEESSWIKTASWFTRSRNGWTPNTKAAVLPF